MDGTGTFENVVVRKHDPLLPLMAQNCLCTWNSDPFSARL